MLRLAGVPRRRAMTAAVLGLAALIVAGGLFLFPEIARSVITTLKIPEPRWLKIRIHTRVVERLEALASSGDAQAHFTLYRLLTAQDRFWEAERHLKQAALLGYSDAQYELGRRSERLNELQVAVRWYKQAAVQNHGEAQLHLAWAFLLGKGIEADENVAFTWAEKSAQNSNPFAAELIGMSLLNGQHPVWGRNPKRACEWLLITHRLGNGPDCDGSLRSKLTASEFDDVSRSVEGFFKMYPKKERYESIDSLISRTLERPR